MKNESTKNGFHYAGLWPRFLALAIDFIFFCLVFFPVTRIVKGTWMMSATDHRWSSGLFITDPLCIIFLVIMVLYFIVLEGLFGWTIGKKLAGIRVISIDGTRPGLGKSLVRNLLRVIDSLPVLNILGVVLIYQSPECARFGDRVAGTRVVCSR